MIRQVIAASTALLIGLTSAVTTHAQQGGIDAAFSNGELQAIQAFYRDSQSRSHGGMGGGGRQGLPPGIARNLERGKALPPGLQTASLPAALDSSLPPAPEGYERVVVDAKILLVETATRLIADVISDAILD